jgi:high-affinity Fe2+/Pb2+ permease
MMIRGYAISARLITIAVGVILLIVAVGLFVRSCDSRHNKAAQARLDTVSG